MGIPLSSWPKCAMCKWPVSAYGIEDENSRSLVLWARCNGVRVHPETGEQMGDAPKVHEPRKGYAKIRKGPFYTPSALPKILARTIFFHEKTDITEVN